MATSFIMLFNMIALQYNGVFIFIDEKNRKKQKPYDLDYFEIIEIIEKLPPLINEINSRQHGCCCFCGKPMYENEHKHQSHTEHCYH